MLNSKEDIKKFLKSVRLHLLTRQIEILADYALKIAKKLKYDNVGTIEFYSIKKTIIFISWSSTQDFRLNTQ